MITSVVTLSLLQAQAHINVLAVDGVGTCFPGARRAWVGFETSSRDLSPLHRAHDGASLVERMVDWDVDGRHSPAQVGPGLQCLAAPSLEIAQRIVRFVLDLHRSPDEYVLCVHCHAGLFRSGAVAEWVRTDLGVEEHESSNRLAVDYLGADTERTFNIALLRLLREAYTGMQKGGAT